MDNSKSEKPSTVDLEVVNRETAFDRKRRIAGAIFGPICALLVWMTPISDLTPEAHTLLAIMTLVALWWITEPVPIPVTSLFGPTLDAVLSSKTEDERIIIKKLVQVTLEKLDEDNESGYFGVRKSYDFDGDNWHYVDEMGR